MEWKESGRPCFGLCLPCDEDNWNLFYDATTITVGNGKMAKFWHSPWLRGHYRSTLLRPFSPSPVPPMVWSLKPNWIRLIDTSKYLPFDIFVNLWTSRRSSQICTWIIMPRTASSEGSLHTALMTQPRPIELSS